jgi:hypothetical protein
LDDRVADTADEAELTDIYKTERLLLYVAATRARAPSAEGRLARFRVPRGLATSIDQRFGLGHPRPAAVADLPCFCRAYSLIGQRHSRQPTELFTIFLMEKVVDALGLEPRTR